MHQAGQLWLRQHRTVVETSLEKSGQAGVKGEDLARRRPGRYAPESVARWRVTTNSGSVAP